MSNRDERSTKPHVKARIVAPLEAFTPRAVATMHALAGEFRSLSPVDTRGPLGYLKMASRDLRDAAAVLVAAIDATERRVDFMKTNRRKRRLAAQKKPAA